MNFTNRLIQERTLCEPSSVQPRPPRQPGRLLYGTSSCVRSLMLPRQTTLQLRCQQQQITTTTMGVFVHKNVRVCVCVWHICCLVAFCVHVSHFREMLQHFLQCNAKVLSRSSACSPSCLPPVPFPPPLHGVFATCLGRATVPRCVCAIFLFAAATQLSKFASLQSTPLSTLTSLSTPLWLCICYMNARCACVCACVTQCTAAV